MVLKTLSAGSPAHLSCGEIRDAPRTAVASFTPRLRRPAPAARWQQRSAPESGGVPWGRRSAGLGALLSSCPLVLLSPLPLRGHGARWRAHVPAGLLGPDTAVLCPPCSWSPLPALPSPQVPLLPGTAFPSSHRHWRAQSYRRSPSIPHWACLRLSQLLPVTQVNKDNMGRTSRASTRPSLSLSRQSSDNILQPGARQPGFFKCSAEHSAIN